LLRRHAETAANCCTLPTVEDMIGFSVLINYVLL